jgi:hypothetical protein
MGYGTDLIQHERRDIPARIERMLLGCMLNQEEARRIHEVVHQCTSPVTGQAIDPVLLMYADRIAAENQRAVSLHPDPIHSVHEAYAVIKEELDEFWEQVKVNPRKLDAQERTARLEKMRNELLQTAAMCLRTMVDLRL